MPIILSSLKVSEASVIFSLEVGMDANEKALSPKDYVVITNQGTVIRFATIVGNLGTVVEMTIARHLATIRRRKGPVLQLLSQKTKILAQAFFGQASAFNEAN